MSRILRYVFVASVLFALLFQTAIAQNTSPYWSLAGNSNATTASKLGTTNSVSLRFFAGNVQRMVIGYTSGNVSIGTTSLNARLTVNTPTGSDAFLGQINGTTRLRLAANGGLTVGGGSAPAANSLRVVGRAQFERGLVIDSGGMIVNTWTEYDDPAPPYAITAQGRNSGIYAYGELTGVVGNGDQVGVRGTGTDYESIGVDGQGEGFGVKGFSSYGIGVYGGSTDSAGVYGSGATGVYGNATTTTGKGVYGIGQTGVYGTSNVSSGFGVYGKAYKGIYGITEVAGGDAVRGEASGASAYGVYGLSASSFGVYGQTNNASSYAGYFNGRVYTTATYQSSDRALKKDITDVTDAMDILKRLKPKSYAFRQDGDYKLMNLPAGKRFGLIAQDVEEVLPTLVNTTEFDAARAAGQEDKNGAGQTSRKISFKALNYTELIPIVIKGMQELDEKTKEIDDLKARIAKLEALLTSNPNTVTSASLSQNTPNPAKGVTRITYVLSSGSSNAQLRVSDNSGKTVKVLSLNQSGTINLNTATLSSGVYHYSLIMDGHLVETKKMLVVR